LLEKTVRLNPCRHPPPDVCYTIYICPHRVERADFEHPMDGQYDRGIRPAETAAREEREGEQFKKLPDSEEPVEQGQIDTTGGCTMKSQETCKKKRKRSTLNAPGNDKKSIKQINYEVQKIWG
jgi:hypothetical protein